MAEYQNYINSMLRRKDMLRTRHKERNDADAQSTTSDSSSYSVSTGTSSFNLSINGSFEPFEEPKEWAGQSQRNSRSSSPDIRMHRRRARSTPNNTNNRAESTKSTFYDRMSIKREPLHYLKTITKPPKTVVPEPHLPIWSRIPIENKIPLLPAPPGPDTITYSRGLVCQQLTHGKKNGVREDSFDFSKDKSLDLTYNALHDPYLKNHLRKPLIRKLLVGQGLVTKDGKVLCNLQEFNRYRSYLSTSHSADLTESLQYLYDKREELRLLQGKANDNDNSEGEKKHEQLERKLKEAKEKARILSKMKEQRLQDLVKIRESRERRIQEESERKMLDQIIRNNERDHFRKYRLQCQKVQFHQNRHELATALEGKERGISARLNDRRSDIEFQNQTLAKQWVQKWDDYEKRHSKIDELGESMEKEIQDRADSRQARVERLRSAIKSSTALALGQKLKLSTPESWLSLKYFYLWKGNTIKRRIQASDSSSALQSRWNLRNDVSQTILSIRQKSSGIGTPRYQTCDPTRIQAIISADDGGGDSEERVSTETSDDHSPMLLEKKVRFQNLQTNKGVGKGEPKTPMVEKNPREMHVSKKFLQQNSPEVEPKTLAPEKVPDMDIASILTGLLNGLNEKSSETNIRVVANSILEVLTDDARKKCIQLCSDVVNKDPDEEKVEEKVEVKKKEAVRCGDWDLLQQKRGKELSVLFEHDDSVAIFPQASREVISNAPFGDWKLPSRPGQVLKPDESVSVPALHSELKENPNLGNESSKVVLLRKAKNSLDVSSRSENDGLGTTHSNSRDSQSPAEIQRPQSCSTETSVSIEGYAYRPFSAADAEKHFDLFLESLGNNKNPKPEQEKESEQSNKSDSSAEDSDSTDFDFHREQSIETTEARRRDRESGMFLSRNRQSRLNTNLTKEMLILLKRQKPKLNKP